MGAYIAETLPDGTFSVSGVPALFGPLTGKIVAPESVSGESLPVAPVAGGVTDLGTIQAEVSGEEV